MSRINHIGKKYNRLTPIEDVGSGAGQSRLWRCQCDCGNETVVLACHMVSGHTKSCGCAQVEMISAAKYRLEHSYARGRTQGTNRSEYNTWCGIKGRCLNPNQKTYAAYGAKGIEICDRWLKGEDGLSGFRCFISDMGDKPSPQHTIDRISPLGNYEPNNCRWLTMEGQNNNRTNNVKITAFGRILNMGQWEKETGLDRHTIKRRLANGWCPEDALSKPTWKTKSKVAADATTA